MEKDLKTAPPKDWLREEGVLHLKKSESRKLWTCLKGCLLYGSWIQHSQRGSRNQKTWVGGRQEDRMNPCYWK